MVASRRRRKFFQQDYFKQFDEQLKKLKTILGHIGLYVGLIAYTALGALIFQVIEHPFERDKLSTLQDLVLAERENLLNLIFNITSKMTDYELKVLRAFVNYGSITYSNGYDRIEQDFESDYQHLRTIRLTSNRLIFESPARLLLTQSSPHLDQIITEIDEALLSYEKTVAVASEEGIDIGTKEVRYEWTYVQSVFFSSTIITTVGYGHIAPVTTLGRAFCILFAIVGIPFTLSVIADVGQIFATLVSTVWANVKPLLKPIMNKAKKLHKEFKQRRRRCIRAAQKVATLSQNEIVENEILDENTGSRTCSVILDQSDPQVKGSKVTFHQTEGERLEEPLDVNDEEEDDKEDEEEDEDPTESMGIGANIVMAFVALGFLGVFLSFGSSLFTHFEDWTFFDAFYFCFITMTTIGFGDIVPSISADKTSYMILCMIYILVGLAFTSTIIELVRRQYAESWRKMQELRAQIQAQLKLADHLRKMGEQGKDIEGMDVDLNQLRANLSKFKRFGKDFDISDLDWIDRKRRVRAVTIFFYETSV